MATEGSDGGFDILGYLGVRDPAPYRAKSHVSDSSWNGPSADIRIVKPKGTCSKSLSSPAKRTDAPKESAHAPQPVQEEAPVPEPKTAHQRPDSDEIRPQSAESEASCSPVMPPMAESDVTKTVEPRPSKVTPLRRDELLLTSCHSTDPHTMRLESVRGSMNDDEETRERARERERRTKEEYAAALKRQIAETRERKRREKADSASGECAATFPAKSTSGVHSRTPSAGRSRSGSSSEQVALALSQSSSGRLF